MSDDDEFSDTDSRDGDGCTPLFVAACDGEAARVAVLLAGGAAVGARDYEGSRPLDAAACNGHTAVVRLLLEAGAAVDAVDSYGGTALMAAASDGHVETARALLDAGADPRRASDDGGTALAGAGSAAVARLLLDRGAPAEPVDGTRRPVELAAARGDEELVRLLLDRGARGDAPALRAALKHGRAGVASLLAGRCGVEVTPAMLGVAAAGDCVATLEAALAACRPRPGPAELGPLLLRVAEERGDRAAKARALLDHGAPAAFAGGAGGVTPLHEAARENNQAVARLLVERGADVCAADEYGQTPAVAAVSYMRDALFVVWLLDLMPEGPARDAAAREAAATHRFEYETPESALALAARLGVPPPPNAARHSPAVAEFWRLWAAGEHPLQLERRAVLAALDARGVPLDVARLAGDFCHARARV